MFAFWKSRKTLERERESEKEKEEINRWTSRKSRKKEKEMEREEVKGVLNYDDVVKTIMNPLAHFFWSLIGKSDLTE